MLAAIRVNGAREGNDGAQYHGGHNKNGDHIDDPS